MIKKILLYSTVVSGKITIFRARGEKYYAHEFGNLGKEIRIELNAVEGS